jgi:hypothetical protein
MAAGRESRQQLEITGDVRAREGAVEAGSWTKGGAFPGTCLTKTLRGRGERSVAVGTLPGACSRGARGRGRQCAGDAKQTASSDAAARRRGEATRCSIGGRRVLGDVLGGDVRRPVDQTDGGAVRAMAWTTTRRSGSMAALSVKSRAMTTKTIRGGSAAAASRGSRSSRPRCAAACRGRDSLPRQARRRR